MTQEQIEISLQAKKLKLPISDRFTHFLIVPFLAALPLTLIFLYLKDMMEGVQKDISSGEMILILIFIFLAFLFYRIQSNRLKFREIETNLPRHKLDVAIENVGKQLEWHLMQANNKCIIAKTRPSFFSGSWGEQITILFDNGKILANSICDPNRGSSVVSMGRNKENIERLFEEIKKAGG